ncbi:MAG: 2-oxo-4-hydroxy-4-carboxy-5-ureidoimidazoline decarboxylase [Halieaceae bacterium]|jgi:2-oxo-4-hydroxy-4-carboxy-5-ureidoimidazoline decarboxylase
MNLAILNNAGADTAAQLFRQCCTSEQWILKMVAQRPYADIQTALDTADSIWRNLHETDYLEAFDGHPKIGDVNSLKKKYASTKSLAAGEQVGVNTAGEEVIEALARGNADYETNFGFIFIVCATGKSAAEMNQLLQSRLANNRATELLNAAEEQRKIFHLRLEKFL